MASQPLAPDNMAQQHSDQLFSLIKNEIIAAGGKISFSEYMHLCLYTPGLGYYSGGSHKLGTEGDFTTAPEISSLFSQTLAHHIKDVFSQTDQPNVLEFGAGSGKMAVDILLELEQLKSLPESYFIIEASANLRERQQIHIEKMAPHLKHLVRWLDRLPNDFIGVVLANEVCDAMPVHRLHFADGEVFEQYVEINSDGALDWCSSVLVESEHIERAKKIQNIIGEADYTTEVNLQAEAWLGSVAETLAQGAVFIIDYGYPKTTFYHPERTSGTLMCYYQQQGHDNPFIYPGLQDITAHIDFTALAESAQDNHLDVVSFQSQADFLIAGGITDIVTKSIPNDQYEQLRQTTELKQLVMPNEMGESFKVLTLSKNVGLIPRSLYKDRRYSL